MDSIARRYALILDKIKQIHQQHHKNGPAPTLIAVSKTKPFEMIQNLYELGHRDFGENYVQELVQKASQARIAHLNGIRWHMIGHLQSNKIKSLLPWVNAIHAVDSIKKAQEIQRRCLQLRENLDPSQVGQCKKLSVYIEVNLDHEPTKSGVQEVDLLGWDPAFLDSCSELEFSGLMAIPNPHNLDSAIFGALGHPFERLEKLSTQLRRSNLSSCLGAALSMGMSDDFEVAIKYGATHIRLGSALFGKR